MVLSSRFSVCRKESTGTHHCPIVTLLEVCYWLQTAQASCAELSPDFNIFLTSIRCEKLAKTQTPMHKLAGSPNDPSPLTSGLGLSAIGVVSYLNWFARSLISDGFSSDDGDPDQS